MGRKKAEHTMNDIREHRRVHAEPMPTCDQCVALSAYDDGPESPMKCNQGACGEYITRYDREFKRCYQHQIDYVTGLQRDANGIDIELRRIRAHELDIGLQSTWRPTS